jgi:hypothetical protein
MDSSNSESKKIKMPELPQETTAEQSRVTELINRYIDNPTNLRNIARVLETQLEANNTLGSEFLERYAGAASVIDRIQANNPILANESMRKIIQDPPFRHFAATPSPRNIMPELMAESLRLQREALEISTANQVVQDEVLRLLQKADASAEAQELRDKRSLSIEYKAMVGSWVAAILTLITIIIMLWPREQ